MSLQRTTPPSAEPIVLADAKAFLRVDGSDEDSLITSLIVAARMQCEERLRRTLITSGWTLRLDSFDLLCELPMAPAQAVSSVSYVAPDGSSVSLDPATYVLDKDSEPARLDPVGEWPATAEQRNAVTVTYTAGYGASGDKVPQPIRQWILLAIGDLYANRERSSDKPVLRHDFVDGLLDPYRVWP